MSNRYTQGFRLTAINKLHQGFNGRFEATIGILAALIGDEDE